MVSQADAWEEQRARFRKLVDAELYARLWRQAAWLTGCREEAEDLLQDTLVRAFERLHQLRDDEQAGPWLMAILRRAFLNQLRSRRRREVREERRRGELARAETESQQPASGPGLLHAALLRLKPDQRWLLTVHYLEDVSIRELAAALRLSEAAVRQRLVRARQALKLQTVKLQGVVG